MKKRHTGLSIIIGGLVIVVLLAAYTSYKSYTNIGVGGDDPKVETTNTKSTKNQKSPKKDHKRPNKKDSNIFLQDTKNPDRIIAIHPYGSDGVYLFRKQADNTLYPEYKYFNGKSDAKGNKLTVVSNKKSNSQTNFNFSIDKNGSYQEKSTGQEYHQIPVTADSSQNSKPDMNKNNKSLYINGDEMIPGESFKEYLARISPYISNPTHNSSSNTTNIDYHDYIKLKDGNYFDTVYKKLYGSTSDKINLTDFYNNPQNYIDSNFNIKDDVMYYKQNGQTQVGDDSTNEYLQWGHQLVGTGVRDNLFPQFSEEHPANFDDTKTEIPQNTSNQINSAHRVANFMNNDM